MKFLVTRQVRRVEAHWLPRDLQIGDVVEKFVGVTYGCISPGGIAVLVDDDPSFYEVPLDALVEDVDE